MKKTLYLAFDIGNVLVDVDFRGFCEKLGARVNLSTDEVVFRLNTNQKLHDVGLLTMAEILYKEFGIRSSLVIDEVIKDWQSMGKVSLFCDILNTKYCQLLKEHNYNLNIKVALLSNVGTEHAKLVRELHPLGPWKPIYYLSCEVGVRKPNSLYFHSFLQRYPEFEGCLYIDDLLDNLAAGKKFGFQTQLFELDQCHSQVMFEEEADSIFSQAMDLAK